MTIDRLVRIQNGTARHVKQSEQFVVTDPKCVVVYFRSNNQKADAVVANIRSKRHINKQMRDIVRLLQKDSSLKNAPNEEVYLIYDREFENPIISAEELSEYLRSNKIFAIPKLVINYQDEFRRSVTSYGVF